MTKKQEPQPEYDMSREECWQCGGTGMSGHDCGEDCCCCLHPEDNMICDICNGTGYLSVAPACPADIQPEPFKRYDKYEVLNLDDIGKYLTPDQKTTLASIIHSIQEGRRKDGKISCNSYVVVKEGLPYTEQVWRLIEDYETRAMAEKE